MTVSIDITEEGACAEMERPPEPMSAPGVASDEERTLLGIRQARDLVLAKNRELIDKLARAEDQISELTYERDDLATARDAARKALSSHADEVAGLHEQISRLTEEKAALHELEGVYVLARTEIEAELLAALDTIRAHELEIGELRGKLEAAHVGGAAQDDATLQLEDTNRQLTAAREAQERMAAEHHEALALLTGQAAAAEQARDESQQEVARLVAERDALKQQAAEEKAALEARLAAVPVVAQPVAVAPRPAPQKKATPGGGKHPPAPLSGPPGPFVPGKTPAVAPTKPAPAPPAKPLLSDKELRSSIETLHHLLKAVESAPHLPEPLANFEADLGQLAERSHSSGLDLIQNLSVTAGEFTSRLRAAPARIGEALPALAKTVEMLGWLGLRGREAMIDTTGALVYAVDDDVDNCECIATAFEKVALQTKYSVRPEVALEQIAASACELIVLDVDLPGMDGFEVHSLIRQMPGRDQTPIIFLSGHLSTIERLAALADDHTEFVAKPYNLSELSLRALTRIVEARLG